MYYHPLLAITSVKVKRFQCIVVFAIVQKKESARFNSNGSLRINGSGGGVGYAYPSRVY